MQINCHKRLNSLEIKARSCSLHVKSEYVFVIKITDDYYLLAVDCWLLTVDYKAPTVNQQPTTIN
jgi:hypothetical protein